MHTTTSTSTEVRAAASSLGAHEQPCSETIRVLYERHAQSVYGYLRKMVGRDEAEDLTQQVFLKLITQADRYEPRAGVPFSAWLLRVARNVGIDHLRSPRPAPTDSLRCVSEDAGETGVELSRCLRDALATLPPAQRDVLVLRHVAGLSAGEIAAMLGRSQNAIHVLHHRGRGTLKRELIRRRVAPSTLPRAA